MNDDTKRDENAQADDAQNHSVDDLSGFHYISRRRRKAGQAWINENPNSSTGKDFIIGPKKKNKNILAILSFADVIIPGADTETADGLPAMPPASALGFKQFLSNAFDENNPELGYYAREVPFSNRHRRLENAKQRLAEMAETLNQLSFREYGQALGALYLEGQGDILKAQNIVAAYAVLNPKEFEWLRSLVIEACFSDPKYAGNKERSAWDAIGFKPWY